MRLRISLTKDEILEPTGVASSGEVEDFETHVIHMPRGTKHETSDSKVVNKLLSYQQMRCLQLVVKQRFQI